MDLTIARIDEGSTGLGAALAAEPDWVSWQADTLLHLHLALSARRDRSICGGQSGAFGLRWLGPEDRGLLESLVNAIFAGYPNHYTTNPCLAREAVTAGYAEWSTGFLTSESGKVGLLYDTGNGAPLAFTVYEIAGQTATRHLGGVMPGARGRGLYRQSMDRAAEEFTAAGVTQMVTATQAANVAAVRWYLRQGFAIHATQNTLHVMPRTSFAAEAASRRAESSPGEAE